MSNLKWFRSPALVLALMLVIAACGTDDNGDEGVGTDDADNADDEDEAAADLPDSVRIGGGAEGGVFQVIATGLADVLDRNIDETQFDSEPSSGGGLENVRLIRDGALDFGLAGASTLIDASEGSGDLEEDGPTDALRIVARLNAATFVWLTQDDSDIQSVNDLEGARVCTTPGIQEAQLNRITELHGFSTDDAEMVHQDFSQCAQALKDGSVDVISLTGSHPNAGFIEAMAGGPEMRFVPLESDMVDEITAEYPFWNEGELPAGMYEGQDEAVPAVVTFNSVVTHEDTSDALVYRMLEEIIANEDALHEIHSSFEEMTESIGEQAMMAVDEEYVPMHPGTAQYFEDN